MKEFNSKNLQTTNIPTLLGDIITIYNIITGNMYFIAKQIAEILGYHEADRLTKILKSREFKSASQADLNEIKDLETNIGHELAPRGMTIINLSGLNRALIVSTKLEADKFQEEVIPVIESHIKSLVSKNNESNKIDKIYSLLEENNKQLQMQLNIQAIQTEQRMVALEDSLVKKLKVKIQSSSYGTKTPRTSCDIDTYVTIFNAKYNKHITKTTVHTLLRNFNLINKHNTMPTEEGLNSGILDREIFNIIYKNGTIGKSIKTVIYEDQFTNIHKALLNSNLKLES